MATKVTQFDRNNLDEIRQAIDTALRGVGNQYGIVLGLGRITYLNNQFTTKLKAAIVSGTPNPSQNRQSIMDIELANGVRSLGTYYGVKVEDIGKIVMIDGQKFKFLGLKTRARRMPYIYENLMGRRIKSVRNYVDLNYKRSY